MDDAPEPIRLENLGTRIVQAAHLAVALHLRQAAADAAAGRAGAGRLVIDAKGVRVVGRDNDAPRAAA